MRLVVLSDTERGRLVLGTNRKLMVLASVRTVCEGSV
jgi:hypothetical protein